MTTETQWAARKFWRDAYVSGVRITFNSGEFRFFRCLWPSRLRVETFGKFGHFPVEPIQPTAELCAALEPHKAELAHFLHQPVPTKISERFAHLLNKDYELYELQADCEALGLCVYGLPMDGGIFPMVVAGEVSRGSQSKPPAKPQILLDYLEGKCQNSSNGYSSKSQPSQASARTAIAPTSPPISATPSVTTAAKVGATNLARQRGRLSLARMYMRDIENRVDFGKMVDGRGNSGASSKKLWLAYIAEIAIEVSEHLPEEAQRLTAFLETNS